MDVVFALVRIAHVLECRRGHCSLRVLSIEDTYCDLHTSSSPTLHEIAGRRLPLLNKLLTS
jgi:hypothetical protein